jgi:hypothetical protein
MHFRVGSAELQISAFSDRFLVVFSDQLRTGNDQRSGTYHNIVARNCGQLKVDKLAGSLPGIHGRIASLARHYCRIEVYLLFGCK